MLDGYDGDAISEAEENGMDEQYLEEDADREMFGDEADYFGLGDIGNK